MLVATGTPPAATPTVRVAVYVPIGYTIQSRPVGSVIGFGLLLGTEAGSTDDSSPQVFPGSLTVADPAAVANDPGAQACDPGSHVAVWMLSLETDTSETLSVPVFVDAPAVEDPAGATYRIQFCSPLPAGQKLLYAALLVNGSILVEPTAAAAYLWRAYVTPAAAGSSDPDPAHTFEVRAVLPIPQVFTLQARYDSKTHEAVLSGQLAAIGKPTTGARVRFSARSQHASAHFGPVKTDSAGRYSYSWPVVEATTFTATVDDPPLAPCSADAAPPGGCLSTTTATPPDQETTLHVPLHTDPKRTLRAADRALAARVNLKLADFPAGWQARSLAPDDLLPCPDFHPDESRLTLTGVSYSQLFSTGSLLEATSLQAVASLVRVWRTPTQAKVAFAREAARGQIECVVDDVADSDDASVVSAGVVSFPRLGRVTRAFRVVVAEEGEEQPYYLDVVLVLSGRSVATMVFAAVGGPSAVETSLAQLFARRAARS
jgi:hypothetical protein